VGAVHGGLEAARACLSAGHSGVDAGRGSLPADWGGLKAGRRGHVRDAGRRSSGGRALYLTRKPNPRCGLSHGCGRRRRCRRSSRTGSTESGHGGLAGVEGWREGMGGAASLAATEEEVGARHESKGHRNP